MMGTSICKFGVGWLWSVALAVCNKIALFISVKQQAVVINCVLKGVASELCSWVEPMLVNNCAALPSAFFSKAVPWLRVEDLA